MCQMWKLSFPRNRRGKKQQKSCQRTFLLDYKAMRINFFPDWPVLQPKYSTFLFSFDMNKLSWKHFHCNWKHTKLAACPQVVGFVLSVYVSPQILLHPVSALAGSEQSAWVGGRSLEGCPQVPLIEMPIYKPELCFSFFCLFKCFNQTPDLKYYNIAIIIAISISVYVNFRQPSTVHLAHYFCTFSFSFFALLHRPCFNKGSKFYIFLISLRHSSQLISTQSTSMECGMNTGRYTSY